MPKLVLFTFDYELFLGSKSGSVSECLLKPTDKLLALFEKFNYKAVFFIDTVYLLRLCEISKDNNRAKEDYKLISKQLKKMVHLGHSIFPHLHPHWLDGEYNPELNEWSLANKRYYRFADIPPTLQDDLFSRSVDMINSFITVDKRQLTDSYRAGGWSIQQFKNFRKQFLKYNIKNEWSVIPGMYQNSDAHAFDFRKAPTDKPVYNFDLDVCKEDEQRQFTEWTISTLKFTHFESWLDFKISGFRQRFFGRAHYSGTTVNSSIRDEGDIHCGSKHRRIIASFEGLNPFRVKKYITAIRKSNYFQFITHPKLLSDYDFKMMEKLLKILKKDKNIETDFRKANFITPQI